MPGCIHTSARKPWNRTESNIPRVGKTCTRSWPLGVVSIRPGSRGLPYWLDVLERLDQEPQVADRGHRASGSFFALQRRARVRCPWRGRLRRSRCRRRRRPLRGTPWPARCDRRSTCGRYRVFAAASSARLRSIDFARRRACDLLLVQRRGGGCDGRHGHASQAMARDHRRLGRACEPHLVARFDRISSLIKVGARMLARPSLHDISPQPLHPTWPRSPRAWAATAGRRCESTAMAAAWVAKRAASKRLSALGQRHGQRPVECVARGRGVDGMDLGQPAIASTGCRSPGNRPHRA